MRVLCLAALARAACNEPAKVRSADVVEALRSGDFECAVALATRAPFGAEDEVGLEFRAIETSLRKVKEALKRGASGGRSIAPAYQWAQSGELVFISIKFAHKIDAPATLISAGEVEAVEFEAEHVRVRAAKGAKSFALELPLLRAIDVKNCTWSSASVGRATLTMRKAAAVREWWPRLLQSASKPQNQHTWWDKQEPFESERDEIEKEEAKRDKLEAKRARASSAANAETNDAPAAEEREPKTTADAAAADERGDSDAADSQADAQLAQDAQTAAKGRRAASLKRLAGSRKQRAEDAARALKRAVDESTTLPERASAETALVDARLRRQNAAIDADTDAALADEQFTPPETLPDDAQPTDHAAGGADEDPRTHTASGAGEL